MSMIHAIVKSDSLFTSVYVPVTPGPLELEVPHMHTYVYRATHFTAHTTAITLLLQISPSVQKYSFFTQSIYP
jgi:hypothetical protein